MDERKDDALEMTEYQVNTPDYGELIIEIIHKIDNQKFLRFIYELLVSFKKKWGI